MCFRRWLTGISFAMMLQAETLRVPLGLDAYVPAPETNTLTREKVELGRALFFWKGLSRDRSLSCGGCHVPAHSFSDGRASAVGVRGQIGPRRTPTLLNRAWGKSFFWDGRAATLEDQVMQPLLNPKEMDLSLSEIAPRVRWTRSSAGACARSLGGKQSVKTSQERSRVTSGRFSRATRRTTATLPDSVRLSTSNSRLG